MYPEILFSTFLKIGTDNTFNFEEERKETSLVGGYMFVMQDMALLDVL